MTHTRRQYQYLSNNLLVAVGLFCLLMGTAQLGTNVFTKDGSTEQVKITLWKSEICVTGTSNCATATLPSGSCTSAKDRQRALQAFGILLFVASLATAVVSVIDVAKPAFLHPLLTVAFLAVVMVVSLIQWAMVAGSYHATICSVSSRSSTGFRMSASFALDLCTWLASLFALVAVVAMRYYFGTGLS